MKSITKEFTIYTLVHSNCFFLQVEAQELVKFACESLEALHAVKDEKSLIERLQSGIGFSSLPSANQSLGTSMIVDTSSQVTCSFPSLIDNLDSSNLHTGQSTNQEPAVTSRSERGKELAPFDDEMTYSTNDYPDDLLFRLSDLEDPNERHAHNPSTEPGTSFSPLQFSNQSSIDRPRIPSECNKIMASHKKRRFDDPQIAYSPDVDMQYLLESWICESSQDADMQYFAVIKAQRRWKIVSSVVSLMSEIRKRNVVGVIAAGFN